jgi:pSer/pThr/pTyr-binding forkhead associated (FHA) protein
MPKLFVFRGRRKEASHDLDKKRIVIGRAEDADVCLDNPLVSRRHALVSFENGGWRVEDLATSNGLWVNGKRVMTSDLQIGDTIEIGSHVLVFESPTAYLAGIDTIPGGRKGDQEGEATTVLPPTEVEHIQQRVRERMRTHIAYDDRGRRREVYLEKAEYTVGFTVDCDIRLPGNPMLVKHVTRIKRVGEDWKLEAVAALAPVRVNGIKVSEHLLRDGDEVVVKGVSFTYHAALGIK